MSTRVRWTRRGSGSPSWRDGSTRASTANLVNGAVDYLAAAGRGGGACGPLLGARLLRGAARRPRRRDERPLRRGDRPRRADPRSHAALRPDRGGDPKGISTIGRETGVPTIFGIVTADTLEQAAERCGSKMGNRGWDAAQAAVEMANLGEAFSGWRGSGEAEAVVHEHEHEPADSAPAKRRAKKATKKGGKGDRNRRRPALRASSPPTALAVARASPACRRSTAPRWWAIP